MHVFEILQACLSDAQVERVGWVLVHSVWEFALLAVLAAVSQMAARRLSAATRYSLLLLALGAIVVAPAVTWRSLADAPVEVAAQPLPTASQFASRSVSELTRPPRESLAPVLGARDEASPGHVDAPTAPPSEMSRDRVDRLAALKSALQPWLRTLVVGWCLGVAAFGVRPWLSWRFVRRLRSVGTSPVPEDVRDRVASLAERLGVRRSVAVLQSTLARVPVVIGWWKPVVLLPASLLTGLPAAHLEAILAHELAHIRRHDFAVNLLQTLIETVFFYHPAVWWLSRRIRVEREHCCDDMAVALVGSRLEYGRALLAIAELRGATTALALGARSGSLLARVQRLVGRDATRQPGFGMALGFGLFALMLALAGAWGVAQQSQPTPADETLESPAERAAWAALDSLDVTVYGAAADRRHLRQWIARLERTSFPRAKIRKLREKLREPVRAAEFLNVSAAAWPHIARLKSLQELRVIGGDLRGAPMEAIGQLTNLRRLETNGRCNPDDLASLSPLTDLEQLSVAFTVFEEGEGWREEQLRNLLPEELAFARRLRTTLPDREHVILAAVLTDRALDWFSGLKRLRVVKLVNTFISNEGLRRLSQLPTLESLDVQVADDPEVSARHLRRMASLKHLSGVNLSDPVLSELSALSQLEELGQHAGDVTDAGIVPLLKLSRLRRLTLWHSQLTPAGLQRLAELPQLERLDVRWSGSLQAEDVKAFTTRRPQCEVLLAALAEPAASATDLAPAKIAEQVEAAMRRYAAVEYEARTSETRNANYFTGKEAIFVSGAGSFRYVSDGERWLAEEQGFTTRHGQPGTIPTNEVSGFDGEQFFHQRGGVLTIGENSLAPQRIEPREVLWHGGRTASWLMHALKHASARVVRREPFNGHECLVVVSEPGESRPETGPEWRFEVTLSPEQSWLPLKTEIRYRGEKYSAERLEQVVHTPDGDWYPRTIRFQAFHDWPTTDKLTSIVKFRRRDKFADSEFRRLTPLPFGVDIVDHRRSQVWHNDPWWPELAPWLKEQLAWPRANLSGLSDGMLYFGSKIAGQPAPPIEAAEWLNGDPGPWDRPGRRLTVLFFFGGDAIEPTPQWFAGLKGLHGRYATFGLDVVGVATADSDRATVRRTLRSLDVRFPVALDRPPLENERWGRTFAAYSLPIYTGVLLIDADGRVVSLDPHVERGPDTSRLEAIVRERLRKTFKLTYADPATRLSVAEVRRIEAEWKQRRRAARPERPEDGRLWVRLRFPDGEQPRDGRTAQLEIVPELRLLSSFIPGGWTVLNDGRQSVADDTGCDLAGLPKGTYRVTVKRPGFAAVERFFVLPPADPGKPFEVTLQPGDAIHGRVVGPNGQPISDATIRATCRYLDREFLSRHTTANVPTEPRRTDAQGRFAFHGLYEGAFGVDVSAEGYSPASVVLAPHHGESPIELSVRPKED